MIFFLVGAVFLGIAIWAITRSLGRRRRYATAWKNGWIDFYPALVGQIYHCRTDISSSSDDSGGRTFRYYYRAPLKVLYPDGSFKKMYSFEFELPHRPDWYRVRFNTVPSEAIAQVDDQNNNGWAIVGLSRRRELAFAELDSGLTPKQCEAVFELAERSWLRPAGWRW